MGRVGHWVVVALALLSALPAVASADYDAAVLADDPRIYLPLDERSGTTFANAGSDGGTAELMGTGSVAGAYGAVEGETTSDRAVRLDGDDWLELRPSAGSRLDGTYTLEGWTKLETYGGPPSLFSGQASIWFEHWATFGKSDPRYWWGGNYFYPALSLNAWHHVVMTWRPAGPGGWGELKMFIDGVERGTGVVDLTDITIYSDGIRLNAGGSVRGFVDELAVYDYELPAARVAEHYRAATEGFGAGIPANEVPPRPVGEPVVGRTARCDEGRWSGGPRDFTFRWLRDGAAIPRATRQQYVLSADDLRHDVTCEVVASNLAGASAPLAGPAPIAMPDDPVPGSYADLVAEDRPRVYLPLDERTGTTFANRGSDGGEAVLLGQGSTAGDYGAIEGDATSDRAVKLDGDDYLEIHPSTGARLDRAYTLEGWARINDHGNPPSLFSGQASIWFEHWATFGKSDPRYWWGGNYFYPALSLREWHHVAMTWRPLQRDLAGQMEMFIDGQPRGTAYVDLTDFTLYDDARRLFAGGGVRGNVDELAVYDYELSWERIAEHHRRGTEGFDAGVPIVTTAPRVVGEAVVGRRVSCDEGEWSGGPREFTFRWLRDGAPIEGAASRTYRLSATDLGHDVTCAVVARSRAGSSAEAESAPLVMPSMEIDRYADVVMADNPVVYLPFTDIAGGVSPNLGRHGGHAELHAGARSVGGAILGDPDPALAVDTGALTVRPDAGSRLEGEFTAESWVWIERHGYDMQLFNNGASTWFEGNATVAWNRWSFTPPIGLGAWHHVAVTGGTSDPEVPDGWFVIFFDGVAIGRTWAPASPHVYDDARPLLAGINLPGVLDEVAVYDYRLTDERIRAHHDAGRIGVPDPFPRATTPPHVSGDARLGSVITCDPATWSGAPTLIEHRWLRDGTPIAGATEATYAVTTADGGHALTCEARGTNARGTSGWFAADNAVDVPRAPTNLVPPAVTGSPWPGKQVTCWPGVWQHGGTHEVRWQLDGPDVAGLAGGRYDVTGPEGGRLRCLVRMTGPGGTSDWVPSETVVVDDTPPVVTLTCPSDPLAPGDSAVATFSASDPVSGLATPETGTVPLDTSAPGTFTARYTAEDRAGHTREATCDYVVVFPRPSAPVPSAATSTDGRPELSWSLNAGAPAPGAFELEAQRDGDTAWTLVGSPTGSPHTLSAPLADGTWRFRVRVVDPRFTTAWSDVSSAVSVDRTPPTADLECPATPVLRGDAAVATFTASDSGSGLTTPASGPVALDTATAGTFTATHTARDAAGHETVVTCTYSVVNHGPGAPEQISGGNPGNTGLVGLRWPTLDPAEPDPAGYELEGMRQGAGWEPLASPSARTHTFAAPLPEGTWRFRVRAVGAGFDTSWSDPSEAIVVDLGRPRTPVPTPDLTPVNGWYAPGVTVAFTTAGDPDLADGSAGSGVAGAPPAQTFTTHGMHRASATVFDVAGNESLAGTLDLRVDAVAPAITATCPAGPFRVGDVRDVAWTATDAESLVAGPTSGTTRLDTATAGTKTVEIASVSDGVGNTATKTCSYDVDYDKVKWDNKLRTNVDMAVGVGTVVPIRFELGRNDFGLGVLDGAPTVTPVTCGTRDRTFKDTIAAASPDLAFSGGGYTWAFRVPSGPVGTCLEVTMLLDDGQTESFTFELEP